MCVCGGVSVPTGPLGGCGCEGGVSVSALKAPVAKSADGACEAQREPGRRAMAPPRGGVPVCVCGTPPGSGAGAAGAGGSSRARSPQPIPGAAGAGLLGPFPAHLRPEPRPPAAEGAELTGMPRAPAGLPLL
ncbi:unnamed protein product [Lepidochelys olivacea]